MKSGCERIKMRGNRMRWLFMLLAAFIMMLGMSLPVAAGQKWREGNYEFENTTNGVQITAYSGDEKNVTIPGVTHFNNTTYQVAIICNEIFRGNKTIPYIWHPCGLLYIIVEKQRIPDMENIAK